MAEDQFVLLYVSAFKSLFIEPQFSIIETVRSSQTHLDLSAFNLGNKVCLFLSSPFLFSIFDKLSRSLSVRHCNCKCLEGRFEVRIVGPWEYSSWR
jgi:hypothetical protein